MNNKGVFLRQGKEFVLLCFCISLCFSMDPGNMRAVHVGVASHNVFDLAYAYLLAQQKGVKGGPKRKSFAEKLSEFLAHLADVFFYASFGLSEHTRLLYDGKRDPFLRRLKGNVA